MDYSQGYRLILFNKHKVLISLLNNFPKYFFLPIQHKCTNDKQLLHEDIIFLLSCFSIHYLFLGDMHVNIAVTLFYPCKVRDGRSNANSHQSKAL